MAVCPNCGAKIREYAVSCPKCHAATGVGLTGVSTIKLKTNRSLLKYFLLNLITFDIYQFFALTHLGEDLDVIASRYDGKKTKPFWVIGLLMVFLSPLVFPIIMGFVWFDKLCDRIEDELRRRSISYHFDAGTFWGFGVIGAFIVVGPFIFFHKLFKAMNYIAADYNLHG